MTDESRELARTNGGSTGEDRYMPSTEFREPETQWDADEIHLRDCLAVVMRRKWLVVSFTTLIVVSTLILTLAAPKVYRATARLEIRPQDQKITKFEEVMASDLRAREYYETQVALIKSPTLARRVAEKLSLPEHPYVRQAVYGERDTGFFHRAASWIKTRLSAIAGGSREENIPSGISAEELKERKLLAFLEDNLRVSSSRSSMLVDLSFSSPDRLLSRNITNTLADELIHWRMENKLEASKLAREFLKRQIDRAKIDLEKAEEEMNRFAGISGFISLDSKLNSVYRQLEELNSALAMAEAELINKQAVYRQAVEDGPSSLPQVMASNIIADLKSEYARLRSEYEDQSVIFYDEYPAVKALKARMDSVSERIEAEEQKIFLAIVNEYNAAQKRVQSLQMRVADQQQRAIALNESATQYKIMAREVDTNKQIYQSLLQRAKEIESMAGVSSSNIQVVDRAVIPLAPFKPKLKLNLLLALIVGLLIGVGMAFFLEYFNDSIIDPEEISTRFNIPVLGITPLEKSHPAPLGKIFVEAPRSKMAESFRTAKVSIQLSGSRTQSQSILMTSTKPGEGKSTMAANLALAFAGAGEKVVLIDADLRNPRLHKIFDCKNVYDSTGLSRFLAGIGEGELVVRNGEPNLHIIPAGPVPPNPVELLSSCHFKDLLESLAGQYNRIILDGPPFLGYADVLVMSQYVGGILLVCSMGETNREALRDFKKNIRNCRGTILGCMINKANFGRGYGYYSYYQGCTDDGSGQAKSCEFGKIEG